MHKSAISRNGMLKPEDSVSIRLTDMEEACELVRQLMYAIQKRGFDFAFRDIRPKG